MQHKTTKTLAAAVLALMLSTSAYAFEKPVLLQDQGSLFCRRHHHYHTRQL